MKSFKAAFAVMALLFGTIGMQGCATTQSSGFAGISQAEADKVAHGEYSDAAMAWIALAQNPDFRNGKLSKLAVQKVQQYAVSCHFQMTPQIAGFWQSAANGALPYGAAGGIGVGAGAKAAFGAAVKMGQYFVYGALSYVIPGAVNGTVAGSYSAAGVKGGCVRDMFMQAQNAVDEKGKKRFPQLEGAVVEIVYAGKSWGNSRPPALERDEPVPEKVSIADKVVEISSGNPQQNATPEVPESQEAADKAVAMRQQADEVLQLERDIQAKEAAEANQGSDQQSTTQTP